MEGRRFLVLISVIWIFIHWLVGVYTYLNAFELNITDVYVATKVASFLGESLYENGALLWKLLLNELSREDLIVVSQGAGVPKAFWRDYGLRQLIVVLAFLYGIIKNWYVIIFLFSVLNFIVFYFGWVRAVKEIFNVSEKHVLLAGLLMPSLVFWSSVLHPEALFLNSVGGVLWLWRSKWKTAFVFLVFAMLWKLEITAFVGLLIWLLKRPTNISIVAGLGMLFLALLVFFPDPVWFVCHKQAKAFMLLGNTSFATYPICYTWDWTSLAIVRAVPEVLFSPIVIGGIAGWVFLLENIVVWGIALTLFIMRYKYWRMLDLIVIALAVMLIIGLTFNNAGSIIRYRTVALAFLFLPSMAVALRRLESKLIY
ncbi:MAG: hypothetical protein GXO48_06665 [Chlorobi bacterium]|nr:hypothetical protein [Chlorobiota bacterium]